VNLYLCQPNRFKTSVATFRHLKVRALQFSVDSASHRFVVNVTNKDTGELVRSMPGEAILRIAQNLESLKGVLFDELY